MTETAKESVRRRNYALGCGCLSLCFIAAVLVFCGGLPWLLSPSTPREDAAASGLPRVVGGCQLELRDLPPANKVNEDYLEWRQRDRAPSAKHYRAMVAGRFQKDYTVVQSGGETPLGWAPLTIASFTYVDPDAGTYRFLWTYSGRHQPSFLKLTERRRAIFVTPLLNETGPPMLEIVGVQGVESHFRSFCLDERNIKAPD
jgi:hypothetical protein